MGDKKDIRTVKASASKPLRWQLMGGVQLKCNPCFAASKSCFTNRRVFGSPCFM